MFSFFKKVSNPFIRIGSRFGHRLSTFFSKPIDESLFESLEKLFHEADLGVETAALLTDRIRDKLKKNPQTTSPELIDFVRSHLLAIFQQSEKKEKGGHPHVILVVGVNGSGKTTTLAKLAHHYHQNGSTVLIAAADTFRAASVEQLEKWTQKTQVDLIKSQQNSDPSAVIFDALTAAKARNTDVVLIDTAGRLQTKTELMQELNKMKRTCQKLIPDAPHETLLILDATFGQNAIDQAVTFHQFTPLTGIVLTKLDGSAKGGIAVAIHQKLKIPIQWVGMGEDILDIHPFDAEKFVDALLQ